MQVQATETMDWMPGFCREFSIATGWPVEFTPVEADGAAVVRSRYLANPECCWFGEVRAGTDTVGFLHIDLPQDPGLDHSFLAVCDLARLFAEIAGRTLSAAKSLDSIDENLLSLVDCRVPQNQDDDFIATVRALLANVAQLTDFQAAAFFLFDPQTDVLKLRVATGVRQYQIPRPSRELASAPDLQAVTSEPVLVSAHNSNGADWLPAGYATGFNVAVRSDSIPLGTLWAFDRRGRIPTDRECHILESLAARVGTVLERAVLVKESELQHRQQRDLNVASASQRRDILRGVPRNAGFEAAAVCTSRYELGGDLCQLISLDESRTLVAIGDASGDSVPAAMVMSGVHGALRALCAFEHSDNNSASIDTTELMRRINYALHEMTPSHQFMSLFLGILDNRQQTLRYTNAGHPNPLLIRNGKVRSLESHGMLLGILDDSEYGQAEIDLRRGDVLVAFSDGVSEAMNGRRTMFRPEGIAAAITPPGDRDATELLEAVWSGLETHIADGESGDDRTLMVLRFAGEAE